MMSRAAAVAYGKRTGVKYHVKNTNGGLLGGTKTKEQAEAMKARWEKEYRTNPWAKGVKVYIEEV